MAYKRKLNKRFVKRAEQVATWLEKEWSKKVAEEFSQKLDNAIKSLSNNPMIGAYSYKRTARRFTVTSHNKIYYRIRGKTITFLDLLDTRQNPKKNKYE